MWCHGGHVGFTNPTASLLVARDQEFSVPAIKKALGIGSEKWPYMPRGEWVRDGGKLRT